MTLEFAERTHFVPANDRGVVQLFLENDIDNDLDVKVATKSGNRAQGLARVIDGWHPDSQGDHLTVEAWINGQHLYTAHVYRNGQITAFS